jgi:hypothetical protein
MSWCIFDLELLSNAKSAGQRWLLANIPQATPDSCLVWPYGKADGYGVLGGYGAGKYKYAHRVAYRAVHGVDPDTVIHTCDNPACCNPYHLLNGTQAANNKDRANKGRSAKTVVSRQRLNAQQVGEIKARWVKGKAPKPNPNGTSALALEYGVDAAVICRVIKGTYQCGSASI